MTSHLSRSAPRSTHLQARLAGLGLLLMALLAFYAEFFVRSRLLVLENPLLTLQQLQQGELLFRSTIVTDLLVVVLDVVVAVMLFQFLRPLRSGLNLLVLSFRLVYSAAYGAALVFHALLLTLASNPILQNLPQENLQGLTLLTMQGYKLGWLLALVLFGCHLLLLGVLGWRSKAFPGWIAVLLVLAGLGYMADTAARMLMVNYETYQSFFLALVALPGMVSELSLAVWLLARKRGFVPGVRDQAAVSA